MSLVQACCTTTAVLDFGKLIATGATADVLRDENVMRAYLGTEDVEVAEDVEVTGDGETSEAVP
jgi:ABC-type methionine transport system ATPase subunit